MTYIVEFGARAARDLEILNMEKNAAESQAAARWYNGLEQAVDAPALFPNRVPLAPEARRAKRKLPTYSTAKSRMSIGSFMKSKKDGKQCGCSRFVTVQCRS
jgi:hypothetical protein